MLFVFDSVVNGVPYLSDMSLMSDHYSCQTGPGARLSRRAVAPASAMECRGNGARECHH